jgi:hypothetical protein
MLTMVAIGIVVFILQNVLHEGIGHGGASLLVGGRPVSLSTAYFEWDMDGVAPGGRKFVAAAGSVLNAAMGVLLLLVLRGVRIGSPTLRYFVWLWMTVNFLTATGYLLFSGLLGVGDWMAVTGRGDSLMSSNSRWSRILRAAQLPR